MILRRIRIKNTTKYFAKRIFTHCLFKYKLLGRTISYFLLHDKSLSSSDVEQAFLITKTNREAENIYFINKIASCMNFTCLVDIGCNYGQFCSALKDNFKQIIVVDANSDALNFAKKIIKHDIIDFHNAAIVPKSYDNKLIRFKIPQNNTGLGCITLSEEFDFEVTALKVKELFNGISQKKSIIKIDVEGIEDKIIEDILELQIHNDCIFAFEVLDKNSAIAVDNVFLNKGLYFYNIKV